MSETTHRSLRLALASLLAVALTAQLLIGSMDAGLTLANFFSYFTVLANTASVVMLVLLAFRPDRDGSRGFAAFRGAVTVYMSVTAVVYGTILYPQLVDVGVSEPWIDLSIHVIGPILVAADWIYRPPPPQLPRLTPAWWLAFPGLYLVYSLLRGSLVDWYPYPFLDPVEQGGYGGVAIWSLIVLVVILGFGYLCLWWSNRHRRQLVVEPA